MPRARHVVLAGAAIAAAALIWWAYRPAAIAVEIATVTTGRFESTVDEDGRTRVRDRYVVSAPLAGRLLRVRSRVGDAVAAGETVATILPALPALLDPRAQRELEERLGAAEATRAEAAARVERARAQLDQAQSDAQRTRTLGQRGVSSAQQLERDELALRMAERDHRAAQLRQHAAEHDLEQIRALLRRPSEPPPAERWEVTAPIAGRVLRVAQESEAVVAAGAPLIEIADTGDLEVAVDVLTTDAVRIVAGAPVAIEHWGGADPLAGRVRLVEPAGFTKLSALGVEEQRAWVIIDLASPRERWSSLGDGYRVDVRITVDSIAQATIAPASALFRRGEGWAVFVAEGGTAASRAVAVIARSATAAAIARGLQPGERVIVFPPSTLSEGARIRER